MFKVVTRLDDLLKAYMVRGIVFMEEQKIGYALEVDEYEHESLHILGEIDGEPVAAARMRFRSGYAKLERIAVRRAWRGKGYGGQLTRFMIRTAEDRGYEKLRLHAQVYTKGLYEKLGFTVVGDTFMEAGIEHCLMERPGNDH
jgi:predicted GNAT family N-acyltransferase